MSRFCEKQIHGTPHSTEDFYIMHYRRVSASGIISSRQSEFPMLPKLLWYRLISVGNSHCNEQYIRNKAGQIIYNTPTPMERISLTPSTKPIIIKISNHLWSFKLINFSEFRFQFWLGCRMYKRGRLRLWDRGLGYTWAQCYLGGCWSLYYTLNIPVVIDLFLANDNGLW